MTFYKCLLIQQDISNILKVMTNDWDDWLAMPKNYIYMTSLAMLMNLSIGFLPKERLT